MTTTDAILAVLDGHLCDENSSTYQGLRQTVIEISEVHDNSATYLTVAGRKRIQSILQILAVELGVDIKEATA